jgi:hypothetical protein
MRETHPVDNQTVSKVREKIIFSLTIYPVLSPSMVQIAVTPVVPPSVWRPILEQLIEEGIVERRNQLLDTPAGNQKVKTLLSLKRLNGGQDRNKNRNKNENKSTNGAAAA